MIVGAVGHATYIVHADGCNLLVDPLFTPTFLAGAAEPVPRRLVDLDAIPPYDAILITHAHAGHLEPDTLRHLRRDVPVIVPRDPTIDLVLDLLGFDQRATVDSSCELRVGGTTLRFPGCSPTSGQANPLIEDCDGRFWYLGDRGDMLPADTVELVRSKGPIDLAVVSHPSDHHSYLQHGTWDGGGQEGETIETWLSRALATVIAVGASLSVPGTSSNRYCGDAEWLNRYVHPMRATEFADLVAGVAPDRAVATLDPGDVVVLRGARPAISRRALPWVHARDDDDRGLDPTVPPPPVVDPNEEGLPRAVLLARAEEYLRELAAWTTDATGPYAGTVRALRVAGVRYRVALVFDEGPDEIRVINLGTAKPVPVAVDPNRPPDQGDLQIRIAASVLDRWSRDAIPYYAATPHCRRAGRPLAIGRRTDGSVSVERLATRDLATMHLTSSPARLHRWLTRTYGAQP